MELLTTAALLIVIGLLTYYFGTRDHDYFQKRGIPCMRPWPFLGNMGKVLLCREPMAHLVQRVYNLHPDAKYVGMYDMQYPVVVVKDLDLIKSMAVKNFEHFVDHRQFVDEVQEPLFAKNLFSLRGEKWKDIRNLLSPAFTSSKMKSMFVLMSNCAATFTDYLAHLPESQKTMDVKDAFSRYTNDVIATCAFGISVDSMKNPDNDFYVYGRETTSFNFYRTLKLFAMRSWPTLTKLLRLKVFEGRIAKFFEDIVATTIRTRDENNIYRPDMIQLMMESRGKREPGKELTIGDMTSQAFIFFFGGFDTTSILMCFVGYELTMHTEIQQRLQKEVDEVMRKNGGQLQYEDVIGMEYLDAVMNETLRMYPVAVFLDRMCTNDFELPSAVPGAKPLKMKKGDYVWFPAYGIHRDPKYFEDPETFKPERFLENGKAILNSGAYFPFGMGPRMCIGNRFALLETKVMYCHLLARCDLVPCERTTYPIQLKKTGIAMTAENGFWLTIRPRKNPSVGLQVTNGHAPS